MCRWIKLADSTLIPADMIVFATGLMPVRVLLKMNIVGRDVEHSQHGRKGRKPILDWAFTDFPICLPSPAGSPSVLTNMPRSIEQHVDWITTILHHAGANGITQIEAEDGDERWTNHVTAAANETLLPKANHSWYLGANIPKPRVFMPYAGGLDKYVVL